MESKDRLQTIEGATLELLELQRQFADRLIDPESRARRDPNSMESKNNPKTEPHQ